MLKTVSGKTILAGDVVVIQSIKYVEKFFPSDDIPFGYPKDMERDVCGKVYEVTGINIIEYDVPSGYIEVYRLALDGYRRVKGKHRDWAVGNHMVEPVVDKEYIKYIEENPEYFVTCINSLQL